MILESFCFQPEALLLPAEHLSEEGADAELTAALEARGRGGPWLELFGRALAACCQRRRALMERLPSEWGPARLPNVCLAADAAVGHPCYRPLWKSAWFLYASDFDPQRSNLEFAVFQLLRAEDLLLSGQDVRATLFHGLSYLLTLTPAQLRELRQGCRKTARPDARAYQALADALAWIPELTHLQLGKALAAPRKPAPAQGLPRPVKGTGLVVPAWVQPRLQALVKAFDEAPRRGPAAAAGGGGEGLLDWLTRARPRALVTDSQGQVLWDPDRPTETATLAEALAELGPRQAGDVRLDLERIDAHTRRFLGALQDPTQLPSPSEEISQSDGTYLHHERSLIAYSLRQNSWEPLREASPPLKRLALGARVVHEWGHLCEEAGWICVPAGQAAAERQARQGLARAFERLLAGVPEASRAAADREVGTLPPGPSAGARLADYSLIRFPDYLANVLAQRFLEPAEMEAYVRVNVCTHMGESITELRHLARAALEYQYLQLSAVADPLAYFFQVSAIDRLFLEPGFVRREDYLGVLEAMRALCACYAIDAARFRELPASPA